TFTDLSVKKAGTLTLQFTGAGLTSISSVPVVIRPDAAVTLAILTEPSAGASPGLAFPTQPVVALEDAYGNIETVDNSTHVTASLTSGNGPLPGTTTVTVHAGVATFTNISDNTPEAIVLKFDGGGLESSHSTSVVISTAPSKLVIHTSPSTTATAGQPLQ